MTRARKRLVCLVRALLCRPSNTQALPGNFQDDPGGLRQTTGTEPRPWKAKKELRKEEHMERGGERQREWPRRSFKADYE